MVRNCSVLRRPATKPTSFAVGAYSRSQGTSRSDTFRRAARPSPGGGICTSSRARNTTLPKTRRIGCEKLPAVYCVAGLGSGKPQSQASERRTAAEAKRWMTSAATPAESTMKKNSSNPL